MTGRGGAAAVRTGRRLIAIAVATVLVACGLPGFEPPAAMPDPGQDETAPIGPVIELGRGEAHGMAWRYTVWESRMGSCSSIESPNGGSTSCGGELGSGPMPLAVSGVSSGTGMPFVIEGFVGADVVAVGVTVADGARLPATLLSLARIGADGAAFIIFVPADRPPVEVVALDAGGDVIATEPVDTR